MAFRQILNILAGIFVILAYFPYIRAIWRQETKPSKSTWIIWGSLSALTGAGMYQADALNAQIAVVTAGDIIIIALAFRYGTPGWSKLDLTCLTGATAGLIGWIATNNPLIAVIIGLSITVIGSVPTVVKTWYHPEQENATAYELMIASCIAQIGAIPAWTIVDAAQPIVFVFTSGTILFLIFTRPYWVRD